MSAQTDTPMLYAASCNPPRRAKRQRTGSVGDAPPPASAPATHNQQHQPRRAAARPPILPNQPVPHPPASPGSDSASDGEDEYDPGNERERDAATAPKRRGRKPGNMSRSARESLRKLNHSRIEKARRTKINETLATLSTLIGERERVLALTTESVPVRDEDGEKGRKGKAKADEKEFKLDVLVKAVEYMQELVTRVQSLEARAKVCTQCRAHDSCMPILDRRQATPPSPKRRREDDEDEELADVEQHVSRRARQTPDMDADVEDSYIGDDERGLGRAESEQPSPMPFATVSSSTSGASPRLPPIASWLPHPYVDPSSLMAGASPTSARAPQNAQLPSPPPSGRFRPSITLANMPALTLPGPAHPLGPPSHPHSHSARARETMRRGEMWRESVSASPTWTPEDETAASLLLQIGSKPRSASVSSTISTSSVTSALSRCVLPMTPVDERSGGRGSERSVEVVTPGSLLGMRD